jgi:hypothetical protein
MKEVFDGATGIRTHVIIAEGDEQQALAAALSLFHDDLRMQTITAAPDDAVGYQLLQSYVSQLLEQIWDGERKFNEYDDAVTARLALQRYVGQYNAAVADPMRYEQLTSYYEEEGELDRNALAAQAMLDPIRQTTIII